MFQLHAARNIKKHAGACTNALYTLEKDGRALGPVNPRTLRKHWGDGAADRASPLTESLARHDSFAAMRVIVLCARCNCPNGCQMETERLPSALHLPAAAHEKTGGPRWAA
jgi:hypothetical protein